MIIMLDDLSSVTLDEVDSMSVDAVFDDKGDVIFDSNNYYEEKGLRIFKHPLKIDFGLWAFFLYDRNSLVYYGSSNYVYVFAMSVSKEFNDRLSNFPLDENYIEKGYSTLPGYPNEEVICL